MIHPLDKCVWKYISDMFGEALPREIPNYEDCEKCGGMTNKACYYPLKMEIKDLFKDYVSKNGEKKKEH